MDCLAGYRQRSKGPPQVALIVLLSWITDLLDGPLARRDPNGKESWVGKRDAEADLATSVGLSLYLVLSRYVATWLGLGALWSLPSPYG